MRRDRPPGSTHHNRSMQRWVAFPYMATATVRALDELVTPDELRAAFGHSAKAVWGDPTPEGFFAP